MFPLKRSVLSFSRQPLQSNRGGFSVAQTE